MPVAFTIQNLHPRIMWHFTDILTAKCFQNWLLHFISTTHSVKTCSKTACLAILCCGPSSRRWGGFPQFPIPTNNRHKKSERLLPDKFTLACLCFVVRTKHLIYLKQIVRWSKKPQTTNPLNQYISRPSMGRKSISQQLNENSNFGKDVIMAYVSTLNELKTDIYMGTCILLLCCVAEGLEKGVILVHCNGNNCLKHLQFNLY